MYSGGPSHAVRCLAEPLPAGLGAVTLLQISHGDAVSARKACQQPSLRLVFSSVSPRETNGLRTDSEGLTSLGGGPEFERVKLRGKAGAVRLRFQATEDVVA